MKKHLLLVDDEEAIRETISTFLRKRGYLVATASTGEEAWQVANNTKVDLLICDVMLRNEDGLELLSLFKVQHPNLPVIMLSGIGFDEAVWQKACHKGADGYASKILPVDQLLMEIRRVLRLRKEM